MGKVLRSALVALGLGGTCCSLAASCGDIYLGDLYGEAGGWGGGGSGVGGISISGGGSGDTCSGTCEPLPGWPAEPHDFKLLWLGPAGQAPDCFGMTPTPWFDVWFPDLVAPPAECPPCTCQPPKGSCALPTELAAYSSHPAECPAPMGTPFKAFGAPDGWEGSCTTYDTIPGDPTCAGSTCIQSLMIPPLVMTDPPTCEPDLSPPAKVKPAYWPSSARICVGVTTGECQDPGTFCRARAPAWFLACLLIEGAKVECPQGWTDKHVMYEADTIVDSRGCEECTCGAPAGSKCETSVSVYTDDCCGCSDPDAPALLTLGVDSTGASCGDIKPSGSTLGSKKATQPEYQPGSCTASDRHPIGEATGVKGDDHTVYTACCKQSVVPR
jgi:hypothetical protein